MNARSLIAVALVVPGCVSSGAADFTPISPVTIVTGLRMQGDRLIVERCSVAIRSDKLVAESCTTTSPTALVAEYRTLNSYFEHARAHHRLTKAEPKTKRPAFQRTGFVLVGGAVGIEPQTSRVRLWMGRMILRSS